MAERKTCFVIMPFGKKKDDEGHEIDFDVIYDDIIKEPVKQAGLECIRCDDIEEAGSIHEDMFAQIATADVAGTIQLNSLDAAFATPTRVLTGPRTARVFEQTPPCCTVTLKTPRTAPII